MYAICINHPLKRHNYPYKMIKQKQTQIIVIVILQGQFQNNGWKIE